MTTPKTVRCFGGPLHDKIVTTTADPFLAAVPSPLSLSIVPPEPADAGLNAVAYHLAWVQMHDELNCRNKHLPRRVRNVVCRDDRCSLICEYAVVDGGDAQEVVDITYGLQGLTLAAIGAPWGARRNADRSAAQAWRRYMDRVRQGAISLDEANRLTDTDPMIAPR